MTKYRASALTTKYWRPSENFFGIITGTLEGKIKDGDFIIISEKAISTALNNIVDEARKTPGISAKIISKLWMPFMWGYFLGQICHFGQRLQRRLREYPFDSGSRHKQVTLEYAGLLQTLMFGSEGGIDGSNLPYSFVCLPLENAPIIAEQIRQHIVRHLNRHICVLITDTDRTYSFGNFHFAPRPKPLKGIYGSTSIIGYIFGRTFKLRKRPTPLAVAGCELDTEEALHLANIADKARGPGSGATVWDMAARFKVEVTGVSWEMLTRIKHKPIVIIRKPEKLPK
jgi:F420-0:gamma-glutamyl ligase-like protein